MTSNYNTSNIQEKEPVSLSQIIFGFWKALKKLWPIMVITMIFMGVVGYQRYSSSYVPLYETRATFSITAPRYDGMEDRSYTDNNELASILSVSFDYLINNEVFYEIIKSDLKIDTMPCTITISAVPDTNILSIVTSGSDREMSYKVVQSVLKNYGSVAEFVIGDTQLDVLEEPILPKSPTNPYSPAQQTLLFVLLGIILAAIPIGLYGYFVKKIKSKEDVEEQLNVPFLGMLPNVTSIKDKKIEYCFIENRNVGFRYLEAMRSITSRCQKELEKNNYKVILVTSTLEGEGKSSVALNLACSLSKSQKKVMLIDGDLRRPSLHKMVGQKVNSYKMEDFLQRKIKNSEAIVNLDGTRVLMLAPSIPSKNAVRCLNSEQMEQFIRKGRDLVDYVIIDAPSCSELSDAAILAKYSDGVVYVVKEDFAKVNKIIDTLQEFSYTRTPIIGCVLNGTEGRLNLSYGYGKYYGYGGYGGYGNAYGDASAMEFDNKDRKVSKKIALKTTEEQRRALQLERERHLKEETEEQKEESSSQNDGQKDKSKEKQKEKPKDKH